MKNLIAYVIIGVLLATLFFTRECQRPEDPQKPDVVIDTIIDTVYVDTVVEKPVPYYIHDSFPVILPIDTSQVVDDYYKYKVYKVMLKNDSTAKLELEASVYKNELDRVKLSGTIHNRVIIRTETIEKIIPERRKKVFVGAQVSSQFEVLDSELKINPGLAIGLMYQSKKDHAYSIGYDPFNKAVYGTVWYKISFK